jgi:hypothetical protein
MGLDLDSSYTTIKAVTNRALLLRGLRKLFTLCILVG